MKRRRLLCAMIVLALALGTAVGLATPRGEKDPIDCAPVFGGLPMTTDAAGRLSTSGFAVLPSRAFVVGYADDRMNPVWVCYRVYGTTQTGSGTSRSWKTDARTGARVSDADYKYTADDYDRGHMAPKSAMFHCYGQSAVDETYVLSNACPQRHAFNDGAWGDLEDLVRDEYSVAYDEIWVIAGPVFDDSNGRAFLVKDADHGSLPQKPVEIPDAFYKILIDIDGGIPRTLAFLIDHDEGYGDGGVKERLGAFLVSIDELEARTGLDFLWTLDDAFEGELEQTAATTMW